MNQFKSLFGIQDDPNAPLTPEELAQLSNEPESTAAMTELPANAVVEAPAAVRQSALVADSSSAPQAAPEESQLQRLERLSQELQTNRAKELEDANRRQMYQDILSGVNSNLGLIVGGAQAMNTKAAVTPAKAGEIKQRDFSKEVSERYKVDQEAMMDKYKALLRAQEESKSDAITPYQQAMLELNRNRLSLDAGQFSEAENRRRGEAEDKKIQAVSDRVQKSGLGSLSGQIDEIETLLGMSIEEAAKKNEDVPGFGRGASLVPDFLVGEKAREFRQKVQNLQNIQISKQFGASQTAGEVGRFNREFGTGKLESDKSLLNALAAVKRKYNEDINSIYSGADPGAAQTYSERSGLTKKGQPSAGQFPKKLSRVNPSTGKTESATVNNQADMEEAMSEGFK